MLISSFSLDASQVAKLVAWMTGKPASRAADGAQYEFCFVPTSLGTVVKVKCHLTGSEIDLTDYDSW